MKKTLSILVVVALSGLIGGCGKTVVPVSSNYACRIMTPTGWERGDDIYYGPAQPDIGKVHWSTGQGNKAVLVQTAAFTITEQFLPADSPGNKDKVDHRIMTQKDPMIMDWRIIVMAPDMRKNQVSKGKLLSLFALSNPKPTNTERVYMIELEDLYNDLARLYVRNLIRDEGYKFADYYDSRKRQVEFVNNVRNGVRKIFEERNVPLDLLDVQPSNHMPDPGILSQWIKGQAAQQEMEQIRERMELLKDPVAQYIFGWDRTKDLVMEAQKNGHTIIVLPSIGASPLSNSAASVVPVTLPLLDSKK